MLELKATMSTVKAHFNDGAYQIPFYQRRYEWNEDQVSDLVGDILEHLEVNKLITLQEASNPVNIAIPKYLIGSVFIYHATIVDANQVSKVEKFIIDGQQRMTTITLLAIILRKLIKLLLSKCLIAGVISNDQNAGYLMQFLRPLEDVYKFPENFFEENALLRTKIILNDSVYNKYKDIIENSDNVHLYLNDDIVSVRFCKNLILIEKIFKDQVKFDNLTISDGDKLNKLCVIAGTLINFTNMAVISAHSVQRDRGKIIHSEVMNVFSKINSRGRDLSQSDMLKVNFLQDADILDAKNLAEEWEETFAKQETKQIDTYFNHLYAAINEGFARTVSEAWLVHLNALNSEQKINLLQDKIFPISKISNEVAFANINQGRLLLLSELGFNEWKSVVYNLRINNDQDQIQNKLEKLLKVCFCFSVNGTYEGIRKGNIERIFWSNLDDGSYVDLINSAIERLRYQNIYQIESQKRNFILRCIDRILNGNIGARYDNAILHIEHVLPQNNTNWIGVDGWNDVNCSEWVHRIGNLVLLPARINQAVGNLPFREKVARIQNILSENGQNISAYGLRFSINHQALENITWSPEYVENRQNYILEKTKNWLGQLN